MITVPRTVRTLERPVKPVLLPIAGAKADGVASSYHALAQVDPAHQRDVVTRVDRRTVCDERFPKGTTSADVGLLTSVRHNAALGRYNRLSIEVEMDDIRAATADSHLYLFVEHSSDAVWWLQRSNQRNTYAPDDADIALLVTGSSPGPPDVVVKGNWCDAAEGARNKGPFLTYVRFRMFTDDAELEAHLRVYATSHDATAKSSAMPTGGSP